MNDTMPPLAFQSPESSNIVGARYDPDTEQLTVGFHARKGQAEAREYVYQGISLETWREFLGADSKGGFFASRIKPFVVGRLRTAL